jgi:hypothetical protein
MIINEVSYTRVICSRTNMTGLVDFEYFKANHLSLWNQTSSTKFSKHFFLYTIGLHKIIIRRSTVMNDMINNKITNTENFSYSTNEIKYTA